MMGHEDHADRQLLDFFASIVKKTIASNLSQDVLQEKFDRILSDELRSRKSHLTNLNIAIGMHQPSNSSVIKRLSAISTRTVFGEDITPCKGGNCNNAQRSSRLHGNGRTKNGMQETHFRVTCPKCRCQWKVRLKDNTGSRFYQSKFVVNALALKGDTSVRYSRLEHNRQDNMTAKKTQEGAERPSKKRKLIPDSGAEPPYN